MKSQRIETIHKKFPNEWLLIAIDELDKSTTTPISGRLLAHSPSRDVIRKKSLHPYKGLIFIDYSRKCLPKGYAIAL